MALFASSVESYLYLQWTVTGHIPLVCGLSAGQQFISIVTLFTAFGVEFMVVCDLWDCFLSAYVPQQMSMVALMCSSFCHTRSTHNKSHCEFNEICMESTTLTAIFCVTSIHGACSKWLQLTASTLLHYRVAACVRSRCQASDVLDQSTLPSLLFACCAVDRWQATTGQG